MITKNTKLFLIIICVLALTAGFESALLTLLLCQSKYDQMSLLVFASISRLARWSMNPLLMRADQMIEKDNNAWQFLKCQDWPLSIIREPTFQKDLAYLRGQIEKIRQLIITKIVPAISSVTAAASLLLILVSGQIRQLIAITIIALLEAFKQSIRAKNSHGFDIKSLEPTRKYHYLKSQLFSPIMLREHRVCQSLPDAINETQGSLTFLHTMKRKFYIRVQTIGILIKAGQGLCILLFIHPGFSMLHQPIPQVLNIASLGVIFAAFRLISSGARLGELPAIVLEGRLGLTVIKEFDAKYTNHYIDQSQSKQARFLNSIKRTDVTALTGPNGAGKSTLILAFAQELSKPRHSSPAGFLFQNFGLVQSSIFNNIVLYKKSDTRATEINRALTLSGFKNVMVKYGWDLNTEVGEEIGNGRGISMGEWQKLALARALYHSKEYLILDEPDAHLDLESSQNFEQQIKILKHSTKLIIASHSESLLNHADHVIRL